MYARGLVAIDEMAARAHGRPFTGLAAPEQAQLLTTIATLSARRWDSARGGLSRRASHALGMWSGASAAVELYDVLVSDTLRVFYTSEIAWLWLDYDGPPMPLYGYESPEVPRERRRVVPLSTLPATPARPQAPSSDSADVVVIGSGAGGAVVAKELAEAGLSVIVLEAGRRYAPLIDYPSDRPDFELLAKDVFRPANARRDLYTTPGGRPFAYSRVKGVGGSTLHYVGMAPRLHEADFATRSIDGVGDDWPITYADLEPYYTRVEAELGVSGPDGANPFEPPRSRPIRRPPIPSTSRARRSSVAPTAWASTSSASRSPCRPPTGAAVRPASEQAPATWAA